MPLGTKTLEIERSSLAETITNKFSEWSNARRTWIEEQKEQRNFVFATDTTKTTNSQLPWKNKTTLPKITQIRDNLHANYISALIPNDDFMKWEGYTERDEELSKRKAVQSYMSNKIRESNFATTLSELLYDYIDYGNVFATTEYIEEYHTDPITGDKIPGYIGPRVVRISPIDITFNPFAVDFKETPIIIRSLKSMGDLLYEAETRPEYNYNLDIIKKAKDLRNQALDYSDHDKIEGFQVDGFGSLIEYFQSDYVEILEFHGHIYDPHTQELKRNKIITVIDRSFVVREVDNPSWFGQHSIHHVGWRKRPDNLYAMGPLANLVGMQYRVDHLENLKADVFDLIAHPPLKVKGNVEEFEWAPFSQILLGEDGEVEMMQVDGTALQADMQISILEQKMEELAGAPRQAMGIRTPGEKTAFEVQSLQNAAGRIFQEKVTNFEINLLEPLLNSMLEVSRRNINGSDLIRVQDDDLGVVEFLNVTKEDITAKGKLRPIGARHFAAQAQMVQNLMGMKQAIAGDPAVTNHISGKAEARMWEQLLGLEKFSLVQDNIRLFEQQETQRLVNEIQDQLELEATTPLTEDE